MNNTRRTAITLIISKLEILKEEIDRIKEEEEEYYDNMPDGIQMGEKGEAAENAIGCMEDAGSAIGDAIENMEEAKKRTNE